MIQLPGGILRPGGLAYPGNAPWGIDWTNPAVAGTSQFVSVVASGIGMINLVNGQVGTIGSGPFTTFTANGVGPCLSGGSTTSITFTDPAGANSKQYWTAAAIMQLTSLSGFSGTICNTGATSGNGYLCYIQNPGAGNKPTVLGRGTVTPFNGSTALVVNTPYFVLWGNTPSNIYIYLVNLVTGSIIYSSGSSMVTQNTTTGVIGLFDAAGMGGPTKGLACAMWSYQTLSKQQALLWCRNPWSFWYPSLAGSYSQIVGVTSGSTFQPAWAAQSNFFNGRPGVMN